MNRLQLLNGLKFNDQGFINEKIKPMLPNGSSLVFDGKSSLAFESDPSLGKLNAERLFINGLQKSGPQGFVNLNGRFDNAAAEFPILKIIPFS